MKRDKLNQIAYHTHSPAVIIYLSGKVISDGVCTVVSESDRLNSAQGMKVYIKESLLGCRVIVSVS